MAAYFLDSSALVKRYVTETGTAWVNGLLDPAMRHRLYIARITGAEVTAALTRRERGGHLSATAAAAAVASFQHDYTNRLRPVEITAVLITSAIQAARTHGLRGYDAVQLAAALAATRRRVARHLAPLTLVTADLELLAAGVAEGLTTDDPNTH
ncbi:MAG: type II toxin-antitoxin system VapC family toxin [Acidobacteriota bacterium]|nr:type II toxin-antitoxin system VapC family toxin [Acidobacteriota bacterium]